MDVPPVIGRSVGRIEAERFHRVDRGKRTLDLGPAVDPQEDVATRPDEGQRLERLAAADGAHDVDARDDRAMLARRPADEGEDAVGREADDAAATIEDLFIALAPEPDPVLDLAFLEGQFGQCGERRWPVRQRTAMRAVGSLACACVKEEELDSLLDSKLAVGFCFSGHRLSCGPCA